jgi:hypothetical protein
MWDIDFFTFFRDALATVATVYATVVTIQSLLGWYTWLAGSDKYISVLRRYVVLHGLRLRFRAFGGDVAVILLLCMAFLLLWRARVASDRVHDILRSAQLSSVQHVSSLTQQH